jgi:hypothetical protein
MNNNNNNNNNAIDMQGMKLNVTTIDMIYENENYF